MPTSHGNKDLKQSYDFSLGGLWCRLDSRVDWLDSAKIEGEESINLAARGRYAWNHDWQKFSLPYCQLEPVNMFVRKERLSKW